MKINRLVIILIIIFLLLIFVEISCLAQESVKYEPWKDNFNYAEFWDSLTDNEKVIYLLGVSDGLEKYESETNNFILVTYEGLDNNQLSEEEKVEETKKVMRVTLFLDMWGLQVKFGYSNNIIPIIDDLYQYPENNYISVIDMGFLSLWKNKGEPVEILLKVMRERGETIDSLLKELRERLLK